MYRRHLTTVILILTIVWVPSIAQAKTRAGGNCSKAGSTTTISGAKYRCAKSGKNLNWKKINASIKPTTSPTTPIAKPAQVIIVPSIKAVEITDGILTGFFTSTSKLQVGLTTITPLICGVQADTISVLQTGTCKISAS